MQKVHDASGKLVCTIEDNVITIIRNGCCTEITINSNGKHSISSTSIKKTKI